MTTMTEKLLAKAADYEQKAQALRFAAAEMNGDAVETKRKTAVGTLEAAIALRRAQSNGHAAAAGQNGHQAAPRRRGVARTQATMGERQATIRAFLEAAGAPQTTRQIQNQLEAAGQDCSTSWVLKVLNGTKDVHKVGKGIKVAWALGKATKAAKPHRPQTKAIKQAMRERIATVLSAYDREIPKAPGLVAKSFGLTIAQSGLAPLVHQGYLKKKRDGYIRTAKAYVVDGLPSMP